MDEIKAKLKEAWNENPLAVIGVGAFAVTAVAKLLDAVTNSRSARIHDREVRRRERKDRR